jgi:hypothetical protein
VKETSVEELPPLSSVEEPPPSVSARPRGPRLPRPLHRRQRQEPRYMPRPADSSSPPHRFNPSLLCLLLAVAQVFNVMRLWERLVAQVFDVMPASRNF